ncbi:hypothetical protein BCR42DRAFT_412999 [Absidia repens]|uniref:Protein EFR3 n=1 Tax=Absidia repens TaxID=90262 RepID=A0A1X2IKF9_9FUNG|nr:hypothetical protein BCR42DRAFT_412999 [Absidia repens]
MVGCCGRFRFRYIKHARLVNNCYPQKVGQVEPRPAELSYLTFYASSRPAKLTKVGTYLCQKVKYDIRKGRKENNKVSLLILKALIQSCNRDLSLFCRSAVVLLTDILDTRDMDLIDSACDTFYVFCSYYDGANLGVDPVFTNDYENIVKRFATFAVYLNDETCLGLQMRYSGHRALAAIVNSTAINSNDITVILDTLIPPLLATVEPASQSAWSLAKSVPSIDVRSSVFALENLTIGWIQQLAAQTLSLLFSLSNGTGVRASLATCKEYYSVKQKWWPTEFCESISELVLQSIQPQYRYLMLMNVLYYLHQHVDMTDVSQVDRFVGNVAILRAILTSNLQLMGIPVLELLTALYTLMMRSLTKTGTIYDSKPTTQHPEELKHYSVQHDLFESIVGLASQSYYANQWNDIISYIIAKLRSTSSYSGRSHGGNENTLSDNNNSNEKRIHDDVPDYLYQQCSVRFLDIFQANAIKALEDEPADANTTFTVEIWTPGLEILYDSYQDIRLKFADTLIHFLNATLKENSYYLSCLYTSFHQGHPNFIHQLLNSIFVWSRLDNLDSRDIMAIYQLLCCIPKRFNGYGIIRTVPFIFALQNFAEEYVDSSEGAPPEDVDIDDVMENPRTMTAISAIEDSNGDRMTAKKSDGADCDVDATKTIDNQPISADDSMIPGVPNDKNEKMMIPIEGNQPAQKINQQLHQSTDHNTSQKIQLQCSLAAITLEWMIIVAKATSMNQLLDYVKSIKNDRREQQQIPRLDLSITPTVDASIIDEKDDELNKVTEWMDRQKVIEAILEEGKLQDSNGTTDMNLEDKLYVEWGSDAYNNQEKSFRIEIDDSNTANTKPKLTPAITNSNLQHHQNTDKSVINVENLKGALAAQLLGNEQNEDQSTQNIQDHSQVKNELDHLLSGLHSSVPSTTRDPSVSLVNPPY